LRIIFRNFEKKKVSIADDCDENEKKQNYFVEVTNSSSIHGCNQIVFKNHHFIEKYVYILERRGVGQYYVVTVFAKSIRI
jgi:hypothetical protein